MRKHPFGIALAMALLAGTLVVAVLGVGPLPPLGAFLDPVRGVWAAVTYANLPVAATASIPNLTMPVEIRYDASGVPHIFAASEEDVMRALGYVIARDRLFQLELQARAGAGTLTELVGPVAIRADSEPRRLGMPRATERALARLAAGSPGRRILDAYADGVNAYIDNAPRAEWPVEYKLLSAQPARWKPINTLHLYNRMAWTLAYTNGERNRLAAEALVGPAAARAIFPVNTPIQEPIQPNGTGAARTDFLPLPPPGAKDSGALALLRLLPRADRPADASDEARMFASNNWAVSPSRSKSGHALLAGDPHLELTLPSIWYEVHLVVPGRMDVYGVTIPGAPGVVIGFTPELAWSFTNTGADVLDYYRESVDDPTRPTRYRLDGVWKELERREEVYRGKKGERLRVDTLLFTHRGPLMRLNSDWVSMRWTANEPSDLVTSFLEASRATTATEFLDLLAREYFVLAQNVIVAARRGNIAIRSTGHYPIRPDDGDGLAIRDGSTSASDWKGFWPVERYPQGVNPAQGFLASANQQPIDPLQETAYLGYDWGYEPWRALQINRLLRANAAVTLDDMRRYQTDPGSVRAELFVPYFLRAASAVSAGGEAVGAVSRGSAAKALQLAGATLARWDRKYTRTNTGAVLFETAMAELVRRTWDELVAPNESTRAATPSGAVLLELLHDSASAWWDDGTTADVREDRDAILAASLTAAYDTVIKRYGAPERGGWTWERVATADMHHLLRLPGFSSLGVPVQGGRGTLNPSAQNGGFGSSWRMVVELGDHVRAMETYPGGQSGNPASARYRDRLRFWRDGDLEFLITPAALDSLTPTQVSASLVLTPGRARP